MLVLKFCGGLGNQMYQYAYGLKLKKYFPECIIKKDTRDFRTTKYHYGYEIEKIFGNPAGFEEAGVRELKELKGELPVIFGGKISRITEPIRETINKKFFLLKKESILDEQFVDGFQLIKLYSSHFPERDFYLQGFWADINYYLDDLELLRSSFVFPRISDSRNMELIEKIQSTSSISVHIRRGDYVNSEFDVLTLEYYKKAIKYIENIMPNSHYFFFSDDVGYIEQNFRFIKNKTIVNWNRGKESWKDMQMMSCCRGNIIANSTFSQWGALLNCNKDKIVIYPDKKMKNIEMEELNIPGWYKAEV